MIGEAVWQALEIGEAHTVSPDDVIPVGEQRMGEMGFGGQPGIGE
jgi:hypothetical protein